MKKYGLVIILLFFLFSGCRKGDEDPFFSLKSRTKRICGEWRVIEYKKLIFVGSDPWYYDTYELRLDGGQGVLFYRGFILDQYSLIENWTFNKDGTFKIVSDIADVISIQSGTWSWNGRNKNSEYKKKECVLLKNKNYNYNNGEEIEEYSGLTLAPSYTMALVKLTDDSITFISDIEIYIKSQGYQRIQTTATLLKTSNEE